MAKLIETCEGFVRELPAPAARQRTSEYPGGDQFYEVNYGD